MQGPFDAQSLVSWYDSGNLPSDLLVARAGAEGYEALNVMIALLRRICEEGGMVDADDEEEDETQWHYVDNSNELQGPFPSSHLMAWFDQGHLDADILVIEEGETEYENLGDVIASGRMN